MTNPQIQERTAEFARLFGLFLLYGEVEDHENAVAMHTRVRKIMETMMMNMATINENMKKTGEEEGFYEGTKKRGGPLVTKFVELLEEILKED